MDWKLFQQIVSLIKEHIFTIIAISISIIALQKSEKALILTQRPYVVVDPVSFNDTNSLIKFTKKDKSIFVECKFQVKNVGKCIAKNISFPSFDGILKTPSGDIIAEVQLPPPMSLGPEQSFFINPSLQIKLKEEDVAKKLNPERPIITTQLIFFYYSEIEPSRKYTTRVKYEIYPDEVRILAQDFK